MMPVQAKMRHKIGQTHLPTLETTSPTYTGCLDSSDEGDVFAFDVPNNHTITAE